MTVGDYPEYLAVGYLVNQNIIKDHTKIEKVEVVDDINTVVVRSSEETLIDISNERKIKTSGCANGTIFDNIIDQIQPQLSTKPFYHLLGFSQGVATACRWVNTGKTKFNSLTLWAGTLPDDIDYLNKMNIFNKLNTKILIGENDEFFSKSIVNEEIKRLNDQKINYKIHHYKGRHKIEAVPLKKLKDLINKEIETFKTT